MFIESRVIRCRKCKRLFSDYADACPECQTKTPRGWVGVVLPVVCVVIAIIVIAWTIYMMSKVPART
ncbi:MAG: hypothetical protein ABIP20_10700 [Chthoniobacteraceae bacterium]